MAAFFLFAGMLSLSTLSIGLYVLSLDFRQRLNRLFALMCFVLFGFISCSTMSYYVASKESLIFWYHLSSLFFGSFYAVNLHFILHLTRSRIKPWHCILIYLPAPAVVCLTFFDYSLFSNFILSNGHWKFIPATDHFGWYFYSVYYCSYLIVSMALMHRFPRRTNLNKEKRQMKIIFLSLLVSFIAGTASDMLLPQLDSYDAPPIGPTLIGFYILGIFYAIFRFKLMDIRPSYVADEVIANISDLVVLVDQGHRVISVNDKAEAMMGRDRGSIVGESFFNLLRDPAPAKACFDTLMPAGIGHTTARICYRKGNGDIVTDSYISKITDRFLDLAGFLVISHENLGKAHIQAAYKVTDREFEIVDLGISGLTNAEMAAKLGLSERTVETHLANIYSKLGISNKVELMGLAFKFGLIDK